MAPSAQFNPTASGRACRTLCQNAVTVWPERMRPDASVTVQSLEQGLYAASDVNPGQAHHPDTLLAMEVEGQVLELDLDGRKHAGAGSPAARQRR